MEYRLSRCDFQKMPGYRGCSFHAVYRITVVSAEGPTCEMLLCAEHVEQSWSLGPEALRKRFPDLNLNMGRVIVNPVLRMQAAS